MLTETLLLALQLPPLAFNGSASAPALRPPRELTCPVAELGRAWAPPPPRFIWTTPVRVDPRALRPKEPGQLVNPIADIFVFLALSGLAFNSGGTVELRPWSERMTPGLVQPPVLAPPFAQPPAKPRF